MAAKPKRKEMAAKPRTFKNKKGNLKFKVTKNSAGTKVLKVEDATGKRRVDHGKIKDLKLTDENSKTRTWISSVGNSSAGNNVLLETHSSPGCFWYFFGGHWWRSCL